MKESFISNRILLYLGGHKASRFLFDSLISLWLERLQICLCFQVCQWSSQWLLACLSSPVRHCCGIYILLVKILEPVKKLQEFAFCTAGSNEALSRASKYKRKEKKERNWSKRSKISRRQLIENNNFTGTDSLSADQTFLIIAWENRKTTFKHKLKGKTNKTHNNELVFLWITLKIVLACLIQVSLEG